MFPYLAKRLLLFIPTLIAVSMIAFGLSGLTPGDAVTAYLQNNPFERSLSKPGDLLDAEKAYRLAAETLHEDLPAFYFSISPKAYPDTLYKVVIKNRREVLEKLIGQYGNWPEIQDYYQSVRALDLQLLGLQDPLDRLALPLKIPLRELYVVSQPAAIQSRLDEMAVALKEDSLLRSALGGAVLDLEKKFESVKSSATPWKLKVPALRWYGLNNQYHAWISHFVVGNFGTSIVNRRPVADKISPALFWTLLLNVSAIILAFLLAVPQGIWAAAKKGGRFDKISSLGLFMLYSLPAFWVGTMLLIFFATREYGMQLFPGPGLGNISSSATFWQKISIAAPHLVLPIICIAYPALAFISRQARGGMVEVLKKDFIRTARAKGVPERRVVWWHGFRNALFPVITLIASVFPAAIAGSVTIEFIFNIPGMGLLTYQSILQKDWPVLFTVLMLGSLLTIVGMLVADVLYAIVDPRVRFK
ncbi:MAG: ABC transporter permease [Lewinellaceae bacterium]|nr:ABC transporter permease [Lewinellaceae bacterium]